MQIDGSMNNLAPMKFLFNTSKARKGNGFFSFFSKDIKFKIQEKDFIFGPNKEPLKEKKKT